MKIASDRNQRYRFLTLLLTSLAAIGPVSTDLYLPSLPSVAEIFGVPASSAQLTLSVFIGGFAVATIFHGTLSDRFGRRPVLLAGLIVFVLASIGCMQAQSVPALIGWRFLQALGGSAGMVVTRAVVRDLFSRDEAPKILSYISGAMALAPAVAPTIGGVIHLAFGWRGQFAALAVLGTLLLVATILILPESNQSRDSNALSPRQLTANIRSLFADRTYIGYALTFALSYSCLFSFISGGSFIVIDLLGVAPQNFGFLFFFIAGSFALGGAISARVTVRFGILKMIGAGVVLGAVAAAIGLGLAVMGILTLPAVVMPVALVFFSCGLVFPNAIAGAIGPFPRTAGLAASIASTIQLAMGAAVGAVVGLVLDDTSRPMFAVIFAGAVVALLAYFGYLRPAVQAKGAASS